MSNINDDFTMSYMDSCDKIPVLLIHGFPLDSSMWELQFQDIGDMARLIAPDLRGHGMSETTAQYDMSQLAADCAGLIDSMGIQRPIVVCGLSMGGYVALEFYRRYPERVAGLILAATRAGADSEEGKKGRDEMITAVSNNPQAIANAMLPKFFTPQTLAEDEELVGYVNDIMLNNPVEGMIGALTAMKERADSTDLLAEITVPTLIIHGEDDNLIPLSEAEAMLNAIPDAELAIISDAGHLPNLEQPEPFNDAIIEFLEMLTGDTHEHHHHAD